MSQLAYHKKGILLFHDIQPSTAQALPQVLRSLKARGYRVVHLRPVAPATTLPEFDAMARRYSDAKRIASARSPLANRGVTWPMAGPAATVGGPGGLPSSSPNAAPTFVPPAYAPPPAAIPPPVIVRTPRVREEPDWRASVYGR
jgi:hypothetical protein